MTPTELTEEWQYRFFERLGLLLGTGKLTLSADFIARQGADEAIRKLANEREATTGN